jgi:hypothetical protein
VKLGKDGHSDEFPCPWCGKPLRLWRETFKGGHNVHVRTSHTHNASDNCMTPAVVGAREVHVDPKPDDNFDGECG